MEKLISDFALANVNIAEVLALESKNRIVGTTYEINDGRIVAINEKNRTIIGGKMWVHNEQKYVADKLISIAKVKCISCGNIQNKYVKSHYTGGEECVLRSSYCEKCGSARLKTI
jgi:hypothetical protein